jgi:RNA polymerase sigma-70 factor (ECF subfamily)
MCPATDTPAIRQARPRRDSFAAHAPLPREPSPVSAIDPRFVQAFRAEFRGVATLLRRLGVRPGDVEDVTQELFLTVHRRWADYDPARPVRPWLRAFAVRAAADYRQLARVRRERSDDTLDPTDEAAGADAQIEARDQRRAVMEALDALAPERRDVLVLVDLEESPVPEAAEALGVPLNTAYSRLREARKDFAAAVRRNRLRQGETP